MFLVNGNLCHQTSKCKTFKNKNFVFKDANEAFEDPKNKNNLKNELTEFKIVLLFRSLVKYIQCDLQP